MPDNVNETPTLAQVIQQTVEARLCDLHTAMPGRILSYDAATQKAKVQPELKRKFRDGSLVDPPVIPDVPVAMPRAGKAFLSLPLKQGDQVLLIFGERSLDTWKQNGGSVDPSTESRKHDYSDAYAIPGGYPFSNPAPMDPNDLILVNDQSKITLKSGGKFNFEKIGGDEILDILIQWMEINQSAVTNTMLGPQKKVEEAQLKPLTEKLKALKG